MRSAGLVWVVFVGLAAPRVAEAELLAARAGEPVPRVVARSLVVVDDGDRQITQETLVFEGVRGRFAWLFAVPATPRFPPPVPDLEATAAELTSRREPFRFVVRDRPLGPSLASRLVDDASPEAAAPSPEPAALEVIGRATFEGSATTSTVTKQFVLPPALERFATRYGLELPAAVAAAVAKHFNEDHVVVGIVYGPSARAGRSAPNPRHVAGPLRYDVPANPPVNLLSNVAPEPTLEIFTIGAGPRVPAAIPTVWSETPWAVRDPEPGSALVFGSQRWLASVRGAPPWVASGAVTDRSAEVVTHLRYRPSRESYRDVVWDAVDEAPSRPRRGSAADVFWALVFGAVPVFAAPESWVLYLLQRRARDRATPTRVGWATRAWFIWPLVVGAHWLATLEGGGRWAALLPFAIALIGLRRYEPEHSRFVRARFEKKKKKAGKK